GACFVIGARRDRRTGRERGHDLPAAPATRRPKTFPSERSQGPLNPERILGSAGDALVDRRVRAGLEHDEFAALDPVLQRVGVTASWRPKVIWVGAAILPSWPSASCAMTAFDWRMKASSGCCGRLRTKAASWSI